MFTFETECSGVRREVKFVVSTDVRSSVSVCVFKKNGNICQMRKKLSEKVIIIIIIIIIITGW